ncbi:MAG: M23 family metallopeptidase [Microcoleaceae cyanobacterium]
MGRSIPFGLGIVTALLAPASAIEELSVPTNPEFYDTSTPYPYGGETTDSEPVDANSGYGEPTPESYIEPVPEDLNYSEPLSDENQAPIESYNSQPSYSEEPAVTEAVPLVPPPTVPLPALLNAPPQEEAVQPGVPLNESLASPDPANLYIDPTDYSIGATGSYESPGSVIFSERSSGCETVVGLGETVAGLCAPNSQGLRAGNGLIYPVGTNVPGQPPTLVYDVSNGQVVYNNAGSSVSAAEYWAGASGESGGGYSQIPIARLGGGDPSAMTSSGMAYYNRTKRPPALAGNGDTSLLFPLSIPAPITSLFGWRHHPVLGHGRFHNGLDFGADPGTPVVASYSGQVSIADWLGGYGLAVVLDHGAKSQETLYGHLSELFVKPGEQVKQGEVIGRVGSTGLSTGPHLHFELRRLTDQGWVAINPQSQIEFALAGLLNVLKVTDVPPESFIAALSEKIKDAETGEPKLPPLPPGMEIVVPQLEPPTVNFGFKENLALAPKSQE